MGGSGTGRRIGKEIGRGTRRIQGAIDPRNLLPGEESPPPVPPAPEFDAERDRLLREALISRLRSDFQRGTGREATIATSAAGVTSRTRVLRRKLAGVA